MAINLVYISKAIKAFVRLLLIGLNLFYNADEAINVFPLKGRMVVFEVQILKPEVKPVQRRERLSITAWLKPRNHSF
ncbi:MAG TPA: 2OG-Fe(II) oxygenase [Flavobacterium sp.]|nr:2OG-Fe(II) oxygenase [Flavobacterium sp.]